MHTHFEVVLGKLVLAELSGVDLAWAKHKIRVADDWAGPVECLLLDVVT